MPKVSIALLTATLSSVLPRTATAEQPKVGILGNVTRDHQQNAGAAPISQISRQDCLTDDSFDFTLELEHYEGYALEVWAGTACEARSARQSNIATCWQLAVAQPQSETFGFRVGVRDLLRGRTGEVTIEDGGTSSNVSYCEPTSAAIAPQMLDMYVLLLDANGSTAASSIWRSSYKLIPPSPLSVGSVASGDGQLTVELSSSVSDQTFNGVLLFCDPAPHDPNASANAQTTTTDAGVFVPTCSPSTELVAGADAVPLGHLLCGAAQRNSRTVVVDGLVNGVSYNIAAASVDSYGNVGPLSESACQVPQARQSNPRAQACASSGAAGKPRGSQLIWLVVLGAGVSRRWLARHRGSARA